MNPSVMLSPNAMNRVKRSLGVGTMVIVNEQAFASVVWSGVQVTVDVPTGNLEPETGEQELLSTGTPATVGRFQLTVSGNASTDCRFTDGGQDMTAAVGIPGGIVGPVGASFSQPAARTARTSARCRTRDFRTELLGQNVCILSSVWLPPIGQPRRGLRRKKTLQC